MNVNSSQNILPDQRNLIQNGLIINNLNLE